MEGIEDFVLQLRSFFEVATLNVDVAKTLSNVSSLAREDFVLESAFDNA